MRPAMPSLARRFHRLALVLALAAPAFAGITGTASAQQATTEAQTEIFMIDSSDGYGINACVATGAACGQGMADAWCRVHDYERAVSFGLVTSDASSRIETSTPQPVRIACKGDSCAEALAITCAK